MNINHHLLETLRNYEMPHKAAKLLSDSPPLIIAGSTAAGKDTIAEYIEENSNWRRMVTHTTRAPREGEKNGDHYWFVTESEMLRLLEGGSMIEAKNIHKNQISGTTIAAYEEIVRLGFEPMLTIDIQGIEEIMTQVPEIRPYFVIPPTFEEWMKRLDQRGHMSHVEKLKRLKTASVELSEIVKNDRFIIIVNHQIHQAAQEILDGITDTRTQMRNREAAKQLIEHITVY